MARIIYTALFYLSLPLFIFHLLSRGQKAPAYRERWGERFALNGVELKNCIWVHAVSMGEVIAAIPLVEKLLVLYPDIPILITTMTPTGSERVKAAFAERVKHVYCPYDIPGPVTRFLDAVNPIILATFLPTNVSAGRFLIISHHLLIDFLSASIHVRSFGLLRYGLQLV